MSGFRDSPETREILLMATECPPGHNIKRVCPRCRGGLSREESLSLTVTERNEVKWICFRASCEFKGSKAHGAPVVGAPISRKRPVSFTGDLSMLTTAQEKTFHFMYGLTSSTLKRAWVHYAETEDRYSFAVVGPTGKVRGTILRSFGVKGPKPKAMTYKTEVEEPFIGWYGKGRQVVVVEDILSALKVSQAGARGVALNGTHLTLDMAREIADFADPPVVLALDKGTMPLQVVYRNKYDTVWDGTKIWQLDRDLKYETEESIKEALRGEKTSFCGS
jgi:hypothetical protein